MDTKLRRSEQVCATITGTMGLLDHSTRRLVADPRGRLLALADPRRAPQLLGEDVPAAAEKWRGQTA
jgi:hypothetical protein